LEYKLDKIDTEDIIDDYYVRIFLVNDLDTNLISIFLPEIEQPSFGFVKYDDRGKIIPAPCEIMISAFKEAPFVQFTKE
jgi:hypothetical protein